MIVQRADRRFYGRTLEYGLKLALGLAACGSAFGAGVGTPVLLTSCQDISVPGNYSLAGDLVQPQSSTPCLNIHDTKNVHLNCKSHMIKGGPQAGAAVVVTNVQKFSVASCNLQASVGDTLAATNSRDGLLTQNTFGNLSDQLSFTITFSSVNSTKLVSNTVDASFQQTYSNGNTFRYNKVTCPVWMNFECVAGLLSTLGSNTIFDHNVIDGKASAATGQNGADDGIVIQDESGDVISNNTIQNTWDEGVETLGNITNLQISGNSFNHIGLGAIGGWYWNSWQNVSVTNNTASNALTMFYFFRSCGLRPQNWDGNGAPADSGVYFENTVFSGNQFASPVTTNTFSANIPVYNDMNYDGGVCLPGERVPQPADFYLLNDTFTQNNFGHIDPAPTFAGSIVPGYVVDGGGNICLDPGPNYPLLCK